MTSGRTRRLAAATLALTAALGLSGCGVGMEAQTSQQYQPGIGANVREGDVQLYNALLVLDPDGTLAFSAGLLNATDDEQQLVGATFVPLDGGEPVQAEPGTDVTLEPQDLFTIGTEGELAGIDGANFVEGRYVTATLVFADAGEVTVEAPIVRRSAMYSSVASAPAESAEDEAQQQAEEAEAAETEADEGTDPAP